MNEMIHKICLEGIELTQSIESAFKTLVTERHAVRKYQTDHTIPADELQEILQLAHTAPSAWNLQHWRVIVVQDPEKKQALLPIANGQQHVAEASVVFIILGDIQANRNAEAVFRPLVEAGKMKPDSLQRLVDNVNHAYESVPTLARDSAFQNASLFAMQLMLACKAKGYDSCPMVGFQKEPLIEALRIPERYIPVMMITAGVAREPAKQTLRLPLDQIVIHDSF